jgi:hypothetical protein
VDGGSRGWVEEVGEDGGGQLGGGPVDLLDHGPGLFKWIGGEGERFEFSGILEAVIRTMGA